MARIDWLPEALTDVERLYNFLYDKDADAAIACVGTILDGIDILKTSPRIGRPMSDETGRRELFMAFGAGAYVLRYMLTSEAVVVVIRVWHSRENRG